MHKFTDTPVTIEEFHQQFGVKLNLRQETSWVKHLKFFDNHGNSYEARLRWDENSGYEMFWDTTPSVELTEMTYRPEFEYIIDSYTETELENR